MNRLLLVRHGITEWNQGGRYQGQIDVPLSAKGRLQIAALRERLRDEEFTVCYTSALSRARESAEILLEEHFCPLRATADLNEMSYGAWEGLSRAEIMESQPASWAAFLADPTHAAAPGGETRDDLQRRVDHALALMEAEHRGGTVLVAAHGGSVRAIITHYLAVALQDLWKLRIDNASLSILDLYPDGAMLSLFNDTAHLGWSKVRAERRPAH